MEAEIVCRCVPEDMNSTLVPNVEPIGPSQSQRFLLSVSVSDMCVVVVSRGVANPCQHGGRNTSPSPDVGFSRNILGNVFPATGSTSKLALTNCALYVHSGPVVLRLVMEVY